VRRVSHRKREKGRGKIDREKDKKRGKKECKRK